MEISLATSIKSSFPSRLLRIIYALGPFAVCVCVCPSPRKKISLLNDRPPERLISRIYLSYSRSCVIYIYVHGVLTESFAEYVGEYFTCGLVNFTCASTAVCTISPVAEF